MDGSVGQDSEGRKRRSEEGAGLKAVMADTWKNCTHSLWQYGKEPSRAVGSWLGSTWWLRAFKEGSTSTCRQRSESGGPGTDN